jgi:hypothetical protein
MKYFLAIFFYLVTMLIYIKKERKHYCLLTYHHSTHYLSTDFEISVVFFKKKII